MAPMDAPPSVSLGIGDGVEPCVVEGEFAVMHDVSGELRTLRISVAPPERPLESLVCQRSAVAADSGPLGRTASRR